MFNILAVALFTLTILALCVMSFIAGLNLADRYNQRATQATRDALERQYLRLKTGSDADDPVKPYRRRYDPMYDNYEPKFTDRYTEPYSSDLNTGDYDGDPPQPIGESFMDELKKTGKARAVFKKSDLLKGTA